MLQVDAKVLQTYTKVEIIIFPKPPQTHPVTWRFTNFVCNVVDTCKTVEDRLVRQPEKHSREDALSTCLSSYWFALSQLLMLFCCAYCDRSSVPDACVGFDCFQPYEKINSENLIMLLWSYVQHIEAVIGCMW